MHRNNTWMHLLSFLLHTPAGCGALTIPVLLRESHYCTFQDVQHSLQMSPEAILALRGVLSSLQAPCCPVTLWVLLPMLWFQALELTLQIPCSAAEPFKDPDVGAVLVLPLKPWCPKAPLCCHQSRCVLTRVQACLTCGSSLPRLLILRPITSAEFPRGRSTTSQACRSCSSSSSVGLECHPCLT